MESTEPTPPGEEKTPRVAAVFDVDRTLLPRCVMDRVFLFWLFRKGYLDPADSAWVGLGLLGKMPGFLRVGYLHYHGYLVGRRPEDLEAWADACFETRLLPRLSPVGTQRFAAHRAAGHLTILLSGSLLPLVRRLGEHLGADLVVASAPEARDGRLTGKLIGPHRAGPAKAREVGELAARHGFDLAASYCYADHYSDAAMLRLFGHPVAANPDHRLERIARHLGWEVVRFPPSSLASDDADAA